MRLFPFTPHVGRLARCRMWRRGQKDGLGSPAAPTDRKLTSPLYWRLHRQRAFGAARSWRAFGASTASPFGNRLAPRLSDSAAKCGLCCAMLNAVMD
eukprot:6461923-Pyramimonas_sp.AAC.1